MGSPTSSNTLQEGLSPLTAPFYPRNDPAVSGSLRARPARAVAPTTSRAREIRSLKKQLGAAIAMVLVAAVALGSATFAWFVNNTKVTADSATVTAKAANTLLISHGDGGQWGTTAAFDPAKLENLVPVSTVDANSFFKSKTWKTDEGGAYNAETFETATSGTDYYTDTFKVKASQNCGLYLDNETEFTVEGNGNENVLKSMRLALQVDSKTYLYQVDADTISGTGNRYNTSLVSLDADGVKKAINSANTSADINCANIDSSKGVKALSDCVVTAPVSNTALAERDDAKKLCDLTANKEQEIQVLIWMEGCDYDCNSAVVKSITEQAVKCVLGFCAGKTA